MFWTGDDKGLNDFEIHKNNVKIWHILRHFFTQLKLSNGVIYGVDYAPIFIFAKDQDVDIDDAFMQKLQLYETTIISIIKNSSDLCNKEDKEKCKIQHGKYIEWSCKRCKKNPKNNK